MAVRLVHNSVPLGLTKVLMNHSETGDTKVDNFRVKWAPGNRLAPSLTSHWEITRPGGEVGSGLAQGVTLTQTTECTLGVESGWRARVGNPTSPSSVGSALEASYL